MTLHTICRGRQQAIREYTLRLGNAMQGVGRLRPVAACEQQWRMGACGGGQGAGFEGPMQVFASALLTRCCGRGVWQRLSMPSSFRRETGWGSCTCCCNAWLSPL